MEDIESARNLALRILDSNRTLSDLDKGVHSRLVDVDGFPLNKLDEGVLSLEDSLTDDVVPSINRPQAVVSDSEPSARRKWRTEVENLEIDLKGWNYVNSNIQSLFSDEQTSHNMNDFVFDEEQSDNDLYESFTETQSFNDYLMLT